MNTPCFHCPDRAADCHTRCERYLEFRDSRLEENRARWLFNGPVDILANRVARRRRFLRKLKRQGGGYQRSDGR